MPWPTIIPRADQPKVAEAAIERYLKGERIADIAQSYRVSEKSLYAYLTEHTEEAWKSAQLGAALQRLEAAKEGMDAAVTMLDVARARESARLAQWDLERVCRRIYGQEPAQVLGSGVVQINIKVGHLAAQQPDVIAENAEVVIPQLPEDQQP